MTNHEQIIETFQIYGGEMRLGQILGYPWGYEFRARKTEINDDPAEPFKIRFAKRGASPSDNLYVLERKPPPGCLL